MARDKKQSPFDDMVESHLTVSLVGWACSGVDLIFLAASHGC